MIPKCSEEPQVRQDYGVAPNGEFPIIWRCVCTCGHQSRWRYALPSARQEHNDHLATTTPAGLMLL